MDFLVVVLILSGFLTMSNAQSTEEDQPFSHSFAMSTIDLQDTNTNPIDKRKGAYNIKNKLTLPLSYTSTNDDNYLTIMPTQLVEFHPRIMKISPVTVPPKIERPFYFMTTEAEPVSSTSQIVYTDEPEMPIKVLPLQQRGVLDVLFPASRVKSFKSVFDSFKRMLSNTLRKR